MRTLKTLGAIVVFAIVSSGLYPIVRGWKEIVESIDVNLYTTANLATLCVMIFIFLCEIGILVVLDLYDRKPKPGFKVVCFVTMIGTFALPFMVSCLFSVIDNFGYIIRILKRNWNIHVPMAIGIAGLVWIVLSNFFSKIYSCSYEEGPWEDDSPEENIAPVPGRKLVLFNVEVDKEIEAMEYVRQAEEEARRDKVRKVRTDRLEERRAHDAVQRSRATIMLPPVNGKSEHE